MYVAFCSFDGMTVLDFFGVYDPITRLATMDIAPTTWDVCGPTGTVTADGLTFEVDEREPDLGSYDLVVVPGGVATRQLRHDDAFVEWISTAADAPLVASVCTGSLLLGAAGLLAERRATTHPNAFDLLATYATVSEDRIVHDGNVITARGVSSSIDLGLYLVEHLVGEEARQAVATQMDYPYGPYGAGGA